MNEKCKTCLQVQYATKGNQMCPSAECAARMEADMAKTSTHVQQMLKLHEESPYKQDPLVDIDFQGQ